MKKLFFVVISSFALISCGPGNAIKKTNPVAEISSSEFDVLYNIIAKEEHADNERGSSWCVLDIELKKKLTESELKSLSNELRRTRQVYDRLGIFYCIPGMKCGEDAWAIAHFTPNLEIQILGTTVEEDLVMNQITVEGDIIGKWQETRPFIERVMVLYEKDNKIYMKSKYQNGSYKEEEFLKKSQNEKVRYEPIDNPLNEFYIIQANGNLRIFDDYGNITEAIKK